MLAIALAVFCLLATGMLDLVFKLYASGSNSRGLMMAGVGGIWAGLQVVYIFVTGHSLSLDYTTLLYGGLASVVLIMSNILLLETMGRLSVSIASTIYRLNTVPLVLLAIVFLDEEPGWFKLCGVALGLVCVGLLYSKADNTVTSKVFVRWFLLIIVACCLRALYGVFLKAGLTQGAVAETMMLLAAIAWFLGGLLHLGLIDSVRHVKGKSLWLIVLAGALVFTIVWLLTTALSLADALTVMPIANMGFVAAFVFAVMCRLERPNTRKLSAILVAIVSIGVISYAG